jgi:hypothetical protein
MTHGIRQLAATLLVAAASAVELPAQVSAAAMPSDSVEAALRAFSLTEDGVRLNGRYVRGSDTVTAGDTVHGPLVVVHGSADVRGVVTGSVYAIFGDVVVRDGAVVLGGASAWRGRVIVEDGRVRGAMHAWPVAAARPAAPPVTRGRALQLSVGWTGMLIIVGLLVLVFAAPNLEATARAIEEQFGRSFLAGLAGQIAFLPLLLLVVAALAVTVVGILLIPFAMVAAPVALAGLVTLGWTAMALVSGRALRRSGARSPRAAMIAALGPGIALLMLPWIGAAALQGSGTVALVARIVALAVTWVAATIGLGGALLSRAGTSRRAEGAEPPRNAASWQTPTPVAGVAAARRPIPARPGAAPK